MQLICHVWLISLGGLPFPEGKWRSGVEGEGTGLGRKEAEKIAIRMREKKHNEKQQTIEWLKLKTMNIKH